jgi:hypothetical protein
MWQRWKAGVADGLRLLGVSLALSFLILPGLPSAALGRIAEGFFALVMTGLAYVYFLIAIPVVLPSVLEGFGLRHVTSAEAEQKRREAVERKQEELRQEELQRPQQ